MHTTSIPRYFRSLFTRLPTRGDFLLYAASLDYPSQSYNGRPFGIYSLGPFSSEHCLAWNTCSLNTWGYFIQKFSPDGGYSSGENVTSSLFCSFFLLPGNWSNENCVSTIAPLALCQRILSFNPFKKKIQCIRVLIYIVETINFYTFDKMNFIQLIYIISQDISSRNSIVTRI